MIELEQIKKTDPIKMLRGQLNKAFSEIVADPIFYLWRYAHLL